MQYRDLARREHTLEHEFGYILKTLLERGETFASLSRQTGIARMTFSIWAPRLGLKSLGTRAPDMREIHRCDGRKARKMNLDHEELFKLHNNGLTLVEIAGLFNVSASVVGRHIREVMISREKFTVRCEFCEVQFEKGRIDQRFCSNLCGTRYTGYLRKVARRGLGVGRIGYISECRSPECLETWKIVDQSSAQKKYCSRRCRDRVFYLKHRNQAIV